MEKYAKDLKVGDIVNMYCDGWQKIIAIRKRYNICVVFEKKKKFISANAKRFSRYNISNSRRLAL